MAMTKMRTIWPKLPEFGDLNTSDFRLDYDRLSDTLYWDFYGDPRPAIPYPVTDHILYSVDPETEAVVGYQLEGFLAHLIYEIPVFLEFAEEIGLSPDEVEEIRSKLDPETRHRSVMQSLFGGFAVGKQLAAV